MFSRFFGKLKPSTREARSVVNKHLLSLTGVDDYGLPPASAYQSFNSVGADMHGQSVVVQGGKGVSATLTLKANLAALFAPCAPLSFGATGRLKGARLATSALVLTRLAGSVSRVGIMPKPLALARMEGVTWYGSAGIQADLKAGPPGALRHRGCFSRA